MMRFAKFLSENKEWNLTHHQGLVSPFKAKTNVMSVLCRVHITVC